MNSHTGSRKGVNFHPNSSSCQSECMIRSIASVDHIRYTILETGVFRLILHKLFGVEVGGITTLVAEVQDATLYGMHLINRLHDLRRKTCTIGKI